MFTKLDNYFPVIQETLRIQRSNYKTHKNVKTLEFLLDLESPSRSGKPLFSSIHDLKGEG